MVFESVVVDVLNKVLGDYVVNLDKSQLKIGIWGGDVVLKDLALKETALNELNLPVKVVWGQLGKLILKIPWKNLYGSPVLFDIEDLFVLVSPESDIKYDPEKERKWELAAKQDELQRVEEAKKRAADKDLVKANDTFVEKLVTQIIKNVQIRVERIHVRYEDRSTRQGAFSVGATMNKLAVETTDKDGEPCFAQDIAKIIYKALTLDGVSVYWNPNGEIFSDMPVEERLRRFQSDIPIADSQPPGYLYVFGPISSSARLVLNLKPELDGFTTPKSQLDINMDNFSVALTRQQFQDMMLLVENMDRMSKGRPYRAFRPNWKNYRGYYRDWWKFAYNAVLVDIQRRRNDWNWLHMKAHLQQCREYQNCYTKVLASPKPPSDALELAKKLEESLDVFNLVLLRQRADVEAKRLAKAEQEARANRGWFSGWLWSQPTAEEQFSTTIAKQIETAMTGEEKEKLYEAIGYQENAAPTEYPLTFVATRLSFVLARAHVRVFDDDCLVLQSEMKDFCAQLDQRPSASALRIAVSVGEFSVNGLKQAEGVAQLVKSQCSDKQRLIDVIYETNPLDGRCDQRIHVNARPLNVIYNHDTITQIQDIFSSADASGINQVKARTAASLPTFKDMSAMGLQFAVERRTRLDVKVDISASTILVPHSGTYLPDRAMVVLKLGHLSVETEEQKAASDLSIKKLILQGSTEQQAFETILSESYTTFNCHLTGMQVLMRMEKEDWESALSLGEASPLHFLQPTDLKVVVKKCLVTEDARIPKIKIEGILPSICVHVMEERVLALAALTFSMAKPTPANKQGPQSRSSSTWSLASISTHFEQSRRGSAIRAPTAIDNSEIVQGTNVDCKFIMNKLIIQVSKASCHFLRVSAAQLQVHFVQKTLDAVLDVSLSEVAISQIHKLMEIPVLDAAGASGNENLVSLNVVMCERNSPELFTVKGGVLTLVKLKLRKSSLVLHQAALRALIDFGSSLSDQVDQVKKSAGVSEDPATLSVYARKLSQIAEEGGIRRKRTGPLRRLGRNYRDDLIDLRAEIEVERVSIELRDELPIARLSVDGIKLAVSSKRALTDYSIILQGLQVLDQSPASGYSMAVISAAKETIHADVIMYNKEFMELTGNYEVDMSVTATIGQLRLVYLQQFLTNILNFANSFQTAKEAVLEASAAAAERAKQNMMKAYEDASKISLQIGIKAPFIVVPRNKTSADALIIDMGVLSIKNHFRDLSPLPEGTPLLDTIQLTLQDFKLYRAAVNPAGLEVIREHPLLDPVTFNLDVNRNLSAAWYRQVPDLELSSTLGKIQLALDHLDYAFLLSVLEENIGQSDESADNTATQSAPADREATAAAPAVHTAIMFTFSMDSFIVSLHPGGYQTLTNASETHDRKYGLGRFVLQTLALKGKMFSDGSLYTSIRLIDCLLEDTREGKQGWLTTLMERKHGEESSKSMIDVTFQKKGLQTFLDVRIFSFTLILSVDYLLKLAAFFSVESAPEVSQIKRKAVKSSQTKSSVSPLPPAESTLTFDLTVQKPDIILVEKMESIDTDALIFDTEINLKYRTAGVKQVINGSLADLELYSCCFNPKERKKTMKQVIRPVTLSLAGSTLDDLGLNLTLNISPVVISVNPKTIQLLSQCSTALNAREESSGALKEDTDWSSNWHPKRFNEMDYWFLKPDEGVEVFEELGELTMVGRNLSELCLFEMSSVIITVEAGVAGHAMPMLLLEMALTGQVTNWSSNLNLNSTLNLGMQYFNPAIGSWEPVVEPTEIRHGILSEFIPWQLQCDVTMKKTDENDTSSPLSVKLMAQEKLEITVTRTFLDVMTQLGESFANAVAIVPQTETTAQQSSGASYLIKNDFGFLVNILLADSLLKVSGKEVKNIDLKNGEELEVRLPVDISHAAPGRISYSSPGSSRASLRFHLAIKVPELGDACLSIPLDSAVKRLYSVPCPSGTPIQTGSWSIVAEVAAGLASTTVTLRSIVQIHNHFGVSIDVHFMTNRGNELEHVGYVEPHGTLNLPAYAVFTATGELFFNVEGYSFSVVPFIWKRLEQEPSITMQLQCENKEKDDVDPFFMKAVGETEPVYMENTSLHTLASRIYDIHLLPTVELINNLPTTITLAAQGGIAEVQIVPGAKAHVPHANPGFSYITLRIDNYLDKEWSCKVKVPLAKPEVYVWDFESFDSTEVVVINLGVHCTVNRGSMSFALYCPFWMINKTEKQLSYKIDDSTPLMYHPASYRDPIMLSPGSRKFLGKKKGQVKVEQGNWSDKFSLDVAGSSGLVECRDVDGATFILSVTIQLTNSSLTKMAIFTPAYVIVNKSSVALEIQEQGSNRWMTVLAEDCAPLWAKYRNALLVLRVEGTEEQTPPFHFHSTHSCLLMLHNKYGGIYVDVQCTAGGVYINLNSYEPGLAPALVINHTSKTVSLREKGSQKRIDLAPGYCVLHAWQQPTGARELCYLSNQKEVKMWLTEDHAEKIESENLWHVSFLDGLQRIVLFTNDERIALGETTVASENTLSDLELNLHGFGLSIVNNRPPKPTELLYMGLVSSGVLWETRKMNSLRWKPMNSKDSQLVENAYVKYQDDLAMGRELDHIVVLDNRLQVNFETDEILLPTKLNIRRSLKPGLWLSIKKTQYSTLLHGKIHRLQLDNQTHGAIFPVILAPVPPPKTVAAAHEPKPFMEVSIFKRITPHSNVLQYKYFTVLVQEFHVKLDVGFVNSVSSFLTIGDMSEDINRQRFLSDVQLSRQPLNAHIAVISSQEQKDFYDLLHFSPLKIHLSFSMAGKMENSALPEAVSLLLQSVGITLTDIQDAVFRLSYLEKKNIFLTQSQLIGEATTHYSGQALRQVYVVLLGLDVIGNPFGLVTGIGEGVEALFYEPFQGMIQGPGEFAEGLGLGVKRLFGHTVGGAAGAFGRITGTLGKGLAALSLDKEYQQQRLEEQNRSANLHTSVAQGGRNALLGVVHGVTGVVTKPLEGARDEGVGGFFKGMGKGVMGLVTRPVTGVVDFASTSLNAVKRATDHGSEARRLRPPRLLAGETVTPYQLHAAEGNLILAELDNKRFANSDLYQFHMVLSTKDILLLTDKRIIIAAMSDVFGTWQLHLLLLWSELAGPPTRSIKGVVLTIMKKKNASLFSQGMENKLIPVQNTTEQEHLLTRMVDLYKQGCSNK